MLQGQRKKDIRHFVNDNVSKDKQGNTSVRCSVSDYIYRPAVYRVCAFSGNNSQGYSISIQPYHQTQNPYITKSSRVTAGDSTHYRD